MDEHTDQLNEGIGKDDSLQTYLRDHTAGAQHANRVYIGEIAHKENAYPGEHEAIIDRELWESVRAKLAENHRTRRHGTDTSEPSLLSGLVFDPQGSRFSPSHAVKNGKRYRYYVSQSIVHGGSPAAAPSRIPAREMEQVVLTELAIFFASADRVSAILGEAGEDLETTRALVDAAHQFAKALAGASTSGLRELLTGMIVRITIQQDSIDIHVSKEGARARLLKQERILGEDSDRQPVVLTIAMKLKRCGGEMRLIIPGGAAVDQRRQPISFLIKAVTRASDWVRRMEGGEFKNQRDLAEATKLDSRYVNSILRVAFLAPEIVEAIIDGRQPPDLTLGSLKVVIPMSWQLQKTKKLHVACQSRSRHLGG